MQVLTLSFTSKPQWSGLCVFRAQTFLNLLGAVVHRLADLRRQHSEWKSRSVSIPLSYTAHLKDSVMLRLQNDKPPFTGHEPKFKYTFDESKENLLMRSGQATPIPRGRKCLKKNNEQFTEAHRELECWVRSCSERTFAAELLWSFSLAPVCRERGEGQRTYEVVLPAPPPRVRFRFAECVS